MSDFSDSQDSDINLVNSIVQDLYSHDVLKTETVLKENFMDNAVFTSPFLSITGLTTIKKLYRLKLYFNCKKPTITNIVFDGSNVAVIHFTDHISPFLLPSFLWLHIPSITTLYFHPDTGFIHKQNNSWTIEGLLQSIPVVSFCYTRLIRFITSKLIIGTGDILEAAYTQADKMTAQGLEFQRIGTSVAKSNMDRLTMYRLELQNRYNMRQ